MPQTHRTPLTLSASVVGVGVAGHLSASESAILAPVEEYALSPLSRQSGTFSRPQCTAIERAAIETILDRCGGCVLGGSCPSNCCGAAKGSNQGRVCVQNGCCVRILGTGNDNHGRVHVTDKVENSGVSGAKACFHTRVSKYFNVEVNSFSCRRAYVVNRTNFPISPSTLVLIFAV
jgi:hypothetical protein